MTTTERDEDDDDVYVGDVKPIVVIPADVGGLPSPNTPGSQYDQKTFLHGIHLPQLGDRGTYSYVTSSRWSHSHVTSRACATAAIAYAHFSYQPSV